MPQNEMPVMKNNSPRLEDEWDLLEVKNPQLYQLVIDLDKYTWDKFGKNLVITMIYRTQGEQDEIYSGKENGRGRKYDNNPWKSPHQFWHGADIRSSSFETDEIKDIENYLNTRYNNSNFYKWTARNHTVGLGEHFHIQYYKVA